MRVSHTQHDCKLVEESAIKGLPSYYSTCPSQMKYQIKMFWFKASLLYEQLLSSVSYATRCPYATVCFMLFVY